jgi:hypothetical protein
MIKEVNKLSIEWTYCNTINSPQVTSHGMTTGSYHMQQAKMLTLIISIQQSTRIPASAIRKKKETKESKLEKK